MNPNAGKSIALMRGIVPTPMYNQDVNYEPYQEGNFYYLFGVKEVDCYAALDLDTGKATLFVPKLDEFYRIWMTVMKAEDFKKYYEIETFYLEDLSKWLEA